MKFIKAVKRKIGRVVWDLLREELNEQVAREGIKIGDRTFYIKNDQLHISASTPKVKLEGTEAEGKSLSLRENAGYIEIYDEDAGSTLLKMTHEILPNTDGAVFIGSASLRCSGAFADLQVWNQTMKGKLLPDTDATYMLGSETYTFSGAFCDVYLKGKEARIRSSGDCEGFIGVKTTQRFSGVYASEVLTSDLMFSELNCGICGKPFTAGDILTLYLIRADENAIRTIPVHQDCKIKRTNHKVG
ncbi:MAG: hypothetical protein ACXQTS_01875 [Candidatus Methanospirareceae archaeon]